MVWVSFYSLTIGGINSAILSISAENDTFILFVGRNGNLTITVQQYTTPVICSSMSIRPPDIHACDYLLGRMPASQWIQRFGEEVFDYADVKLPIFIETGTNG